MRLLIILGCIVCVVSGGVLFHVKYQVMGFEQEIKDIRKKIRERKEEVSVLRAEWAYLNAPSRLKRLSERYLGIGPINPKQILDLRSGDRKP